MKQIDVPSFSGSFGILPDHVPVLAVLKPGVITVTEDDGSANKFFGAYFSYLWQCRHVCSNPSECVYYFTKLRCHISGIY